MDIALAVGIGGGEGRQVKHVGNGGAELDDLHRLLEAHEQRSDNRSAAEFLHQLRSDVRRMQAGHDQDVGRPRQAAEGEQGLQLGVFKTRERATAGLSALRDGNVDLLSGLRFAIDEVEGIDAPIGYMVLAGPLASQQMAADLCTKLHSRKKVCRLVLP